MVLASIAVLWLAAGGGGYVLGINSGPDLAAAREAGAMAGESKGERVGRQTGYAAGRREGVKEGFEATYRKAYKRAAERAESEAASSAPPPAGQPASCPPGTVSAANGCQPESNAQCAAYQDFVPGQGCVPPLEPGAVEAEPNCPPGEVPVGVTGACAEP